MNIFIKRVYDPVEETDGYRVLVDRVWPRGIKKEAIQMDEWMKEIAPSSKLRKAFNHQSELFNEFRAKYVEELQNNDEKHSKLMELVTIAQEKNVTLLFATKDREYNQARVLRDLLLEMRMKSSSYEQF